MNYDQGVLDELRSLQEEIKVKHAEQEGLMAQSEEAKAALEVHKKDLDQQYAEAEALVAEIVREKLLRNLDKEVPHGTAIEVTKFSERDNGGSSAPGVIDLDV